MIFETICPLGEYFFPTEEDEEGSSDSEGSTSSQEEGEDDETTGAVEEEEESPELVAEPETEYELVAVPPPTEKRTVEPRTLTPHYFDVTMNQTTKAQVFGPCVLLFSLLQHLTSPPDCRRS